MTIPERETLPQRRRRALRTAVIVALVALAFYVGFFFVMHWKHALP
ncbi:MAG: hypothetical protein KGJ56_05625 [Gammaproteobacteria bacterium]|nr:hypothetical protein [Gammaproteobacteria bacterium]